MRSNLLATKRFLLPFHLNEEQLSPELDHAINLLNNTSAWISFNGDCLGNKYSAERKVLVQNGLD
jgi:hypothetical protein